MTLLTEPLTIACAGTHGSGKTCLTRALAIDLQLEAIDVSRPTAAAQQLGYAKAADVPPKQVQLFQWMGLFEQIHQERLTLETRRGEKKYYSGDKMIYDSTMRDAHRTVFNPGWESTGPSREHTVVSAFLRPGFVSDRSTIDFLAYYQYRLGKDMSFETYQDLVTTYADKYSIILYLPPNPNGVEDDNRRFLEGTKEVDENIFALLEAWCPTKYVTVPWLPIDERVEYVKKQLMARGLLY